jgi:hypothetical protein
VSSQPVRSRSREFVVMNSRKSAASPGIAHLPTNYRRDGRGKRLVCGRNYTVSARGGPGYPIGVRR